MRTKLVPVHGGTGRVALVDLARGQYGCCCTSMMAARLLLCVTILIVHDGTTGLSGRKKGKVDDLPRHAKSASVNLKKGDARKLQLKAPPQTLLTNPILVDRGVHEQSPDRFFDLKTTAFNEGGMLVYGACLIFRRASPPVMRSYEVCSKSPYNFSAAAHELLDLPRAWPVLPTCGAPPCEPTPAGHLNNLGAVVGTDGMLAAYGGSGHAGQLPGIFEVQARIDHTLQPPHKWSVQTKQPVISTHHTGCIEIKPHAVKDVWGNVTTCHWPTCGCRFDSKVSAVAFKGKIWVYVRANMNPKGGGRYVQFAAKATDAKEFGNLELIKIIGLNTIDRVNIYFFAVNNNPVDPNTLIALFPISDETTGRYSIAMCFSTSGSIWSPAVDLFNSTDAGSGRTLDHPVDGIVLDGEQVLFYIQHGVNNESSGAWRRPELPPKEVPSGVYAYSLPAAQLRTWTQKAVAQIVAHSLGVSEYV